jgi:AraC family transcriptional regulator
MNYLFRDGVIDAPNEDIPTAIPSLIDAAVAAFDADRDTSRRYLLRASALLRVKRGACVDADSAGSSESGSGLLAWQLNRVTDYIEAHLADKITAMNLADLINVSVGQLTRAFKISVGVPPFHYIGRRRVELACTMMSTTRVPLSQIAIACGLCDQAHLCKAFRRMLGLSPSAWRRTSRITGVSSAGNRGPNSACRGSQELAMTEYADNSGRGQENLSQRLLLLHRIRKPHNRGATEVEVRSG